MPQPGAAAYVGPGDVVSGATVFYGLRAYTLASIGSNLFNITRSSDSTNKTFVSIAGGGFNTADAFFNGSTYQLNTLYDQTGNGNNLTPGSTSNGGNLLLTGGPGGRPCIQFTSAGPQSLVKLAASAVGAQPNSGSLVLNNLGSGAASSIFTLNDGVGTNTAYHDLGVDASGTGNVYIYAGSVGTATCSQNAWHSVQALFNTTSSQLMVDGAATTGLSVGTQPGGIAGAGQVSMGASNNVSTVNPYNGKLEEAGYWHGDKSASFAALTANQRAYWGF